MGLSLYVGRIESVIWIFTARCPLNCVHCYAKLYLWERELCIEMAKSVVKGFAELGAQHIHLTGGDPIATRPRDLLEIARYARQLGMSVSVFSSCTFVPSGVDELSRYVDELYTSVDGYDAETFERVRGAGTWRRFLDGYQRVAKTFSEIHVNIAITNFNYRYVDKILEFVINRLEPSSVSAIPVMKSGRAKETGVYVTKNHFLEALKRLGNAARNLGVEVCCWCTPFANLIDPHLLSSNCRGRGVVDLSPGGNVLLCDVTGVALSNVVELGVRRAIEKYSASDMVRKAMSIPARCRSCAYLDRCGGGCFARSLLEFGRVDVGDPLCPFSNQF